MCPHPDDFLKELVRELGNVKSNESELMGVSSTEINLTLNPKLAQMEGKTRIPDTQTHNFANHMP
jgi:Ras GTPase-activating-like protein IQGAP2/3